MTTQPLITTAVAKTPEEYEACFRLRYKVYVEEMGKEPPGADHVRGMITDELDAKAVLLYSSVNGEVVGTFRFVWGGDGIPDTYRNYFNLDAVSHVPDNAISFNSRLMISAEWRQTQVLAGLLDLGYREGRARGIWLSFLHCAPALIALYEMLGFRRYAPGMIDTDVGLHIPMLLIADDLMHLQKVRSPYLKSTDGVEDNPLHAQWFSKTFPQFADGSSTRYMGIEKFNSLLNGKIQFADHPLFKGIAPEQLTTILQYGVFLHPKAGDLIHREGESSTEVFVLLQGSIELLVDVNSHHQKVLRTLNAGDVFGELAFVSGQRRMTTARALCNTELLAISGASAEKLAMTRPELAAPLFLNISRLLANRVTTTTHQWVESMAQSDLATAT